MAYFFDFLQLVCEQLEVVLLEVAVEVENHVEDDYEFEAIEQVLEAVLVQNQKQPEYLVESEEVLNGLVRENHGVYKRDIDYYAGTCHYHFYHFVVLH